MLRLCPIALLLVTIMGCNSAKLEDVTGTWKIKETSRQLLPAGLNNSQSSLVLNSNGTFTAHLVPGLFHITPLPPRLDGGSGVWKLTERGDKQQIQLDFKVETGPFTFPLEVSKGWTGTTLFYFIGDPDEGPRIDFEKKETEGGKS